MTMTTLASRLETSLTSNKGAAWHGHLAYIRLLLFRKITPRRQHLTTEGHLGLRCSLNSPAALQASSSPTLRRLLCTWEHRELSTLPLPLILTIHEVISIMLLLYYAALLYFALLCSAKTTVVYSSSYRYEGYIYGISHSPIVSHYYNFCSFRRWTVFDRTQMGMLQCGALKHSTSAPSREHQGLPLLQMCHFWTPCPSLSNFVARQDVPSRKTLFVRLPFRREKEMIL